MENQCLGPCLPHCETKNIYLWIGLVLVLGLVCIIRYIYKQQNQCAGPCLSHCETKNRHRYIWLGFVIGLIIGLFWFIYYNK